MLVALVRDKRDGEMEEYLDSAKLAGLDADSLLGCALGDRYLVDIHENLLDARRLGIEGDIPALFIGGRRITDLGKPERVREQIEAALARK